MSTTIKYKGNTLIDIKETASKTLKTAGKYCEADITVEHIQQKLDISWHQCPKGIKDFIENVRYNPNDYTYSYVRNYLNEGSAKENTKPIGFTVEDKTFFNETPNKSTPFSLKNTAGTVTPLDRLRWINTNAGNVRDLGGWNANGGTVKYGMLYRGGEISAKDRDVLAGELGIRRELNLRGTETDNTESVLGSEIYFLRPQKFPQYTLNNSNIYNTLKFVFDGVYHNEPVYFHCYAGADRTGTLAFILEAMLGMNESDIDKEYELTMFCNDSLERTRDNPEYYKALIDEANKLEGGTLEEKIIIYALENGFSVGQINDFRRKMIEGTPQVLYSVTSNLTGCLSDNKTTVVFNNKYKASLTASAGYTLSGAKVTVTMGGADITADVYKNGIIYIENVTGDIVISAETVIDVPTCTNQIPLSIDKNGEIFNQIGYKDGYRLNNSTEEEPYTGAVVTGFIPVNAGDIIRFSGEYIGKDGGQEVTMFFDKNKTPLTAYRITPYFLKTSVNTEEMKKYLPYNYDIGLNRLLSISAPDDKDIAYVRFTLHALSGEKAIITVNEPI